VNAILNKKTFWIITAIFLSVITTDPAIGLCLGAVLGLVWGNPLQKLTGKYSKYLLQAAVIMLGFGLELGVVLKVGYNSLWITLFSISGTLALGWILGKLFKVHRDISVLISTGTAICGGSAIAAMAPAIGASQAHTAIAMAVVFLLNGVALLIFPHIGHLMNLSQADFGLWSALAIHDTSSVVGAAAVFGTQALAIATTVKLTRALWIFPVSFAGAKLNKSQSAAKIQWFLFGFLAAAMIHSFFPAEKAAWEILASVGKRMMVATLFLVGAGLSLPELKKIGSAPLIKAVVLWISVSVITLTIIKTGLVHIQIPM
jgi:uncharacterized integral membrane protein (TIGR00698 family)